MTWQWQGGDFFFKVLVTIFCLSVLFLTVLGLQCCSGSSLAAASGGSSLVVVCRLVAEHGLWGVRASVVVALRL